MFKYFVFIKKDKKNLKNLRFFSATAPLNLPDPFTNSSLAYAVSPIIAPIFPNVTFVLGLGTVILTLIAADSILVYSDLIYYTDVLRIMNEILIKIQVLLVDVLASTDFDRSGLNDIPPLLQRILALVETLNSILSAALQGPVCHILDVTSPGLVRGVREELWTLQEHARSLQVLIGQTVLLIHR